MDREQINMLDNKTASMRRHNYWCAFDKEWVTKTCALERIKYNIYIFLNLKSFFKFSCLSSNTQKQEQQPQRTTDYKFTHPYILFQI